MAFVTMGMWYACFKMTAAELYDNLELMEEWDEAHWFYLNNMPKYSGVSATLDVEKYNELLPYDFDIGWIHSDEAVMNHWLDFRRKITAFFKKHNVSEKDLEDEIARRVKW